MFLEEVDEEYQGAVFRVTQGLEAGVNRIVWGADGKLYIGGVGNPGNWGHIGKLMHGLQRMSYTGDPVFEMLAVRVQPDGFAIEFTEPLAEGVGDTHEDYEIRQWRYEPTEEYGGPKLDERLLDIEDVEISGNRRSVRFNDQWNAAGPRRLHPPERRDDPQRGGSAAVVHRSLVHAYQDSGCCHSIGTARWMKASFSTHRAKLDR